MKSRFTKIFLGWVSALFMLANSAPAAATWLQATVTEVRVIAAGNADDKIVVMISASTGCTYNGFAMWSTDPFFKESYSLLLAAKAAGASIKYDHVYCHSSGFSRGNQYSLVD